MQITGLSAYFNTPETTSARTRQHTAEATPATQTAAPAATPRYDFTNMSRQDIQTAGNQLFKEGKITLDELFRFEHPDGVLRIDGKLPAGLSPTDRINFIGQTQTAISNMEATGEAWHDKSAYPILKSLLAKLEVLQNGGINISA